MGENLCWVDDEDGGSKLYEGDNLVAVVRPESDCYSWFTKKVWGISPPQHGRHDTLPGAKTKARKAWRQVDAEHS